MALMCPEEGDPMRPEVLADVSAISALGTAVAVDD